METLAVFNAKGGVGKTTSTVNLAACFAAMGQRVLVFDLDAQGNATSSLGIGAAPDIGTYDVITGRAAIKDAWLPTFMDGISLVGATRNLATIDVDMALGEQTSGILSKVVAAVRKDVDILIMDCAPTFGAMTINALVSADAVFIPSQPTSYAHDGLIRTWTILSRIRQELHPKLRVVGILPTLCTPDDAAGGIMAAMTAEFGNLVSADTIPLDGPLFAAASAAGVPACVLAPTAPASMAYLDLAIRLLNPDAAQPPRLRRLDDPITATPERRVAVLQRLETWKEKADKAGILDANINVPPVDAEAMAVAASNEPVPPDDDDTMFASIGRAALLIGGALLLTAAAYLLGWAVGAGRF